MSHQSSETLTPSRTASVTPSDPSGDVSVADPVAGELYTFNRYGKHVKTRSLETGATLYSFAYSKNTVFGRWALNSQMILMNWCNIQLIIEVSKLFLRWRCKKEIIQRSYGYSYC